MSLLDSLLLDPLALDVCVTPRADGVLGSGTEEDPYDGSTRATPVIPVSSITALGTTATVTTSVNHRFQSKQLVQVSGVTSGSNGNDGSYYNGTFKITVTGPTTFTYAMWAPPPDSPAPAAPSGITCQVDPYYFDGVMRSLPIALTEISHIPTTNTVAAYLNNVFFFAVGDVVLVSGATGSDGLYYNGVVTITAVGPNYFEYNYAASGMPINNSAKGNLYCQLYQLDAVARAVRQASPAAVRLGPGTMQTKGYAVYALSSWITQTGMKFRGSSPGISVLQLVGAVIDNSSVYQAEAVAIGSPYNQYTDSFEACDFTVDCNVAGQPAVNQNVACSAVQIVGKHTRLRRIRAINFGPQTPKKECFPITAAGAHPALQGQGQECYDCVIQDCILEQPGLNNQQTTTLIGMLAGEGALMAYHRACVIRNCFIDCEYRQSPVPISSITLVSGSTFQVTTRLPHGHLSNDWVRISGAGLNGSSNNSFNGAYQITYVDQLNFKYTPVPAQTSSPTGDMWLGRFSSQYVQISSIISAPSSGTSGTVTVQTQAPHFLQVGSTVVISQMSPGFTSYNGTYLVTGAPAFNWFQIAITNSPGTTGNCSGLFGSIFQGPGADAGRAAVVEGNRVVNIRVGGPYHDSYSSREMVVRNNYYRAVVNGPTQSLSGTASTAHSVTSLSWSSSVATAFCPSDHGFLPGDAVQINSQDVPGYNGNFAITAVPSSTQFQYGLPNDPLGIAMIATYARIWQVDWEAILNNIIELILSPTNYGYPTGIASSNGSPPPSFLLPAVFPQGVIRRNSVRYVDGESDANNLPSGISVFGYGAIIVEENVLDIALSNSADRNTGKPARFGLSVAAEFFANQSSAGVLTRGYDWDASISAFVNELSTNVEDAALLAF